MTAKKELREEWKDKTTWSDGVFESLERFVDVADDDKIIMLARTADVEKFFDETGGTPPEPRPSGRHREYMVEYARLQS